MARFGRRRAAGSVVPRRGGRVGASGALAGLARVIDLAVAAVAVIIAVGVLLIVLEANRSNDIVTVILDAARWLVGPFKDFFTIEKPKLEVAVNWGMALVIYVIVGRGAAALLRRSRP